MNIENKIYVAGHRGLVGSAIVRALHQKGYKNILVKTSTELDLRDQLAVRNFFEKERPEYVFLAAAKVGGILANNQYPADFIYDNLAIQNNIIHESYRTKVTKLLFLGSSCIYPKNAPQPLKEEYLLLAKVNPLIAFPKHFRVNNRAFLLHPCDGYNDSIRKHFLFIKHLGIIGPRAQ